jgi:photosystem II stability/assembly factor-like uncharacterized protein
MGLAESGRDHGETVRRFFTPAARALAGATATSAKARTRTIDLRTSPVRTGGLRLPSREIPGDGLLMLASRKECVGNVRVRVVRLALAVLLAGCCLVSGAAAARSGSRLLPVSIAFWDAQHGLSILAPEHEHAAAMAATADGGRTWRVVQHLRATELVVAGAHDAWTLAGGELLHSADEGRTWTAVSRRPIFDVSFATPRGGMALAAEGGTEVLVITLDGGRVWRRRKLPCSSALGDVGDRVALATPSTGYVLCAGTAGAGDQRKTLFSTRNGGRSWQLVARDRRFPAGYLQGVAFVPGGHGWIWESRGSFVTTRDGGRTWSVLPVGIPDQVEAASVSFRSATVGFALLHDVRRRPLRLELVRTSDGGRAWQTVRRWPVAFWPLP